MAAASRIPPRALDWVERGLALILYAWLAERVATALFGDGSSWSALLLLSEGLVVVFLLIRRPAETISPRPVDWLLALAATAAPLLVQPAAATPLLPAVVCAAVATAGMMVQILAKLALSRSFGLVAAHRGLVTRGPYRVVRHPIYAGYLLGQVGFLLLMPTSWNLAVYGAALVLQVIRLRAEERLLATDPLWREFARTVPRRLIPGLY